MEPELSVYPNQIKIQPKEKTKDQLIDVYNFKKSLKIHEKLIQEHIRNIIH